MSILQYRVKPNYSNRSLFTSTDRAIQALRAFLDGRNYGAQSARECCFFARDHGTTAGLVELGVLDAEDLDGATEAFVGGFDDVRESSPEWNDPTRWAATVPDVREALEYALMTGEFDPLDAPLPVEPDLSAEFDEGRNPWLDYEEAELSEVGISTRR